MPVYGDMVNINLIGHFMNIIFNVTGCTIIIIKLSNIMIYKDL